MRQEEFERLFRSARYHDELPAVVTYRTPEGKPWRYTAFSYRVHGPAVLLMYPGQEPLDVLFSDIMEVV